MAVVAALGTACHDTPRAAADVPPPPPSGAADSGALPAPRTDGTTSLESAIAQRRSRRTFAPGALTAEQIGQLAWAAQGITDAASGHRAAPSAGALYPLELYVVDADGTWHYEPARHRLARIATEDRRSALAHAAFDQAQVGAAAVDLVLTGNVGRTRVKYGDRAERFVHLEAGHAAQNVLLEATALGLASVPVGAIDDDAVRGVLGVDAAETPLYVLCIGRLASGT